MVLTNIKETSDCPQQSRLMDGAPGQASCLSPPMTKTKLSYVELAFFSFQSHHQSNAGWGRWFLRHSEPIYLASDVEYWFTVLLFLAR